MKCDMRNRLSDATQNGFSWRKGMKPVNRDLLDMAYINSLPQPFVGRMLGGYWWPIYDLEVETGLVRIDVCGMLDVKHVSDFTAFRDDTGVVHPAEGFYIDAIPEERDPENAFVGRST